MKLCIVGNSHIIALKEGIEASNYEIEPEYVMAPGSGLASMAVENGYLDIEACERGEIVGPDKGKFRVSLDRFDAIVFVGLGCTASGVVSTMGRMRTYKNIERGLQVVSHAFLVATEAARFRALTAFKLAAALRRNTSAPVFLVPAPSPSEKMLSIPPSMTREYHSKTIEIWKLAAQERLGTEIMSVFAEAGRRACKDVDVTFVPQLSETLANGLTKAVYAVSRRVALEQGQNGPRPHPDIDLLHANAAYGQLNLDRIMDHLKSRGNRLFAV